MFTIKSGLLCFDMLWKLQHLKEPFLTFDQSNIEMIKSQAKLHCLCFAFLSVKPFQLLLPPWKTVTLS